MIGLQMNPSDTGCLDKVVTVTDQEISRASMDNFMPVRVKNLIVGHFLDFCLFFPALERSKHDLTFLKILERGECYTAGLRDFFNTRNIRTAYIEKDASQKLRDYLERITAECVNSREVSSSQKTLILYNHAEYLVERAFAEPQVGHVIDDASKWAGMVGDFLLKDEIAPSYLCRIFSKDYTTFTHSIQVCLLGMAFCVYHKWKKAEVSEFGVGGLFHDVGKIWIDDRILQKPGTLTEMEFEHIQKHPHLGYQHLREMGALSPPALEIILQHHEGTDGKGYPQGLKQDEIHPLARIAHIVDCYDALTTRRPYKGALSPFQALKLMYDEMRDSFDPKLLKQFIRYLGR